MQANGPTIRRQREESGRNLRTFADHAGLSPAYLSRLERGIRTNPSPEVVARIAGALGVPVSDLATPAHPHPTEQEEEPHAAAHPQ